MVPRRIGGISALEGGGCLYDISYYDDTAETGVPEEFVTDASPPDNCKPNSVLNSLRGRRVVGRWEANQYGKVYYATLKSSAYEAGGKCVYYLRYDDYYTEELVERNIGRIGSESVCRFAVEQPVLARYAAHNDKTIMYKATITGVTAYQFSHEYGNPHCAYDVTYHDDTLKERVRASDRQLVAEKDITPFTNTMLIKRKKIICKAEVWDPVYEVTVSCDEFWIIGGDCLDLGANASCAAIAEAGPCKRHKNSNGEKICQWKAICDDASFEECRVCGMCVGGPYCEPDDNEKKFTPFGDVVRCNDGLDLRYDCDPRAFPEIVEACSTTCGVERNTCKEK